MADKEEKILILKITENNCPMFYSYSYGNSCAMNGEYPKCLRDKEQGCPFLIKRTEAIERMVKAIAYVSCITFISDEQWEVVINGFKIYAEAALNALLEDKK